MSLQTEACDDDPLGASGDFPALERNTEDQLPADELPRVTDQHTGIRCQLDSDWESLQAGQTINRQPVTGEDSR